MNVRIQYPTVFNAGIYYENEMIMNTYRVNIFMMTNSPDGEISNIALNRIKYFINTEIDSSIFISEEDVEQSQKYVDAGLKITTMPDAAIDQLVCLMLFYKLTAITEGKIYIGEIELSSDIGEDIIYSHGDIEDIGDTKVPDWWKTADLAHCDSELINTDKIVTVHQSRVWRELDLSWPDTVNSTDTTVVFADFKKLDDSE